MFVFLYCSWQWCSAASVIFLLRQLAAIQLASSLNLWQLLLHCVAMQSLELKVPLCCQRCEERVKESLLDMDGEWAWFLISTSAWSNFSSSSSSSLPWPPSWCCSLLKPCLMILVRLKSSTKHQTFCKLCKYLAIASLKLREWLQYGGRNPLRVSLDFNGLVEGIAQSTAQKSRKP